jgi:hypothetical protein
MNEMIKDTSMKEKDPVGYPLSGHGGDERKDVAAESRDETRNEAEASERWIDDLKRDDQQMTSTLEKGRENVEQKLKGAKRGKTIKLGRRQGVDAMSRISIHGRSFREFFALFQRITGQ